MSFSATIVLPVLSQEDVWLRQSVTSALEQSVPCEVLVVTSAKTKTSNLQMLAQFRRTSSNLTVVQQSKAGFPAALNLGIRLASAPRVGFLLSDDWLDPRAVEECLHHSADIVCTSMSIYHADGITRVERACRIRTMEEYSRQPSLEEKASYLEHFFLFQKRKLLEAGGLDESLGDSPGIDDYDLIWVLLEHQATVTIVEKSLYNYRDHEGPRLTTGDTERMIATMRKILAKHNVHGGRRERLLARKARWFGRPIHRVLSDTQAGLRDQA